jgi:hypothetical protein
MDSRISSASVAQQPIAVRAPSTVASNTAPVELKIPKAEIKVDTETLKKNLEVAINHINEMMRDGGRNLSFSIDPLEKGSL